jgi:long-chain acyl-CoA synthetase
VIQKFQQELERLNQTLPNYKKVQKFILSETEWTTDGGELTTSLKMIRTRLLDKHQAEIEKLYPS